MKLISWNVNGIRACVTKGFEDYFKEAYRLLNYDGLMYIAEPSKTYTQKDRDELLDILRRNGFTLVGNIEDRGKFFYITVIKK
jgi:predicted methyltransferase